MNELPSNQVLSYLNQKVTIVIIPKGNKAVLQTNVNGEWVTIEEYIENASIDITMRDNIEWRVTLDTTAEAYYY